jgi:hypothetical protein
MSKAVEENFYRLARAALERAHGWVLYAKSIELEVPARNLDAYGEEFTRQYIARAWWSACEDLVDAADYRACARRARALRLRRRRDTPCPPTPRNTGALEPWGRRA